MVALQVPSLGVSRGPAEKVTAAQIRALSDRHFFASPCTKADWAIVQDCVRALNEHGWQATREERDAAWARCAALISAEAK